MAELWDNPIGTDGFEFQSGEAKLFVQEPEPVGNTDRQALPFRAGGLGWGQRLQHPLDEW